MQLSQDMLAKAANFFLASEGDQAKYLRDNPDFAAWMNQHGGAEAERRGLITAIYNALPKTNQWLRRVFRERHPEVFSEEALGARRLASVARRLARNPSIIPYYEKALKIQQEAFLAQSRLDEDPPKPWTMERVRRMQRRRRRRMARAHSEVARHRDARKYPAPPSRRAFEVGRR